MKHPRFLLTVAVVVLLAVSARAALVPANRLPPTGTWEAAGVPGGIPNTNTSSWTQTPIPGLDGTGATSAVAAINAAIGAAPAFTVLTIPAGTYRIDGQIQMTKNNVVLRGATDASFGNTGATIFNCVGGSTSGVYIGISSSWGTPTAITGGDIAAGTTVLTVTSSTGFASGRMVRMFQDNDQTIPVLATGGGARLQGQISMITNVSGNNITISPALIFPLKGSLNPVISVNANIRRGIGVENIFFDGTNKTGPYTMQINGAQGCWIKGCQSFNNLQYHIYWAFAVQCEFRHNTIWINRPLPHGPNMSGLKLDSSSSNLIVDNIFYQQFPSIQINGSSSQANAASAGNVIAYNFSTEATNAQPYAAADYQSSHGPHTHYDLYEGNYGEKFQQDAYYGSASHITVARNLLTGDNPLSANNNRIIDICRFSRNFNIVGNVFGSPGKTFTYKATGELTPYPTRYIYRFGYPNNDNGVYTGTAQPSTGDFWADYNTSAGAGGFQEWDLDVEATTLFKGNYNSQDAAIPASESTGAETVPSSYYLSGSPAWFGTLPWPAYEATSPSFSRTAIPAGYRYVNGTPPPTAPSFLGSLADVTAAAGGTVVFNTPVFEGYPAPSYQWKKDGVNLTNGGTVSGATTAILTLTGVLAGDAGTYTVELNNGVGAAATSNGAVMTVGAVIPSFTTQPPASLPVLAGATVNFPVVAIGTPTPTLQWKKNGVDLTNGGIVSGATSATLTLTGVAPADNGTYTIVATNFVGSATSTDAVLTVYIPPVITTQPAASQTIVAGNNATFTVAATGTPTPTFQWQKDGVDISGATSATLTLTSITLADAATYTVSASNPGGEANSNNAVLIVNTPPAITTQPTASQTIVAGNSASFTAAASGNPAPTLQWRKNGVNISGATGTTLSLTSITLADAATYTVVATNGIGSPATSSNAVLIVNTPPAITTQPAATQTGIIGYNTTFTVVASGVPAPTYQWQKGGVDISGATGASLTLTTLTLADAGTFSVIATNGIGSPATSSNSVLTVIVGTVPVITTQPVGATILLNGPASFSVAATGTPTPTFQWQKDGANISGATSSTYSIASVQTTDAGVYTAIATNAAASVTSSGATLIVNVVPAPTISTQPVGGTVAAGRRISFRAAGTSNPNFQWQESTDGGTTWTNLTDNSAYGGTATNTLTILHAGAGMTGNRYRVVATNVTASVTSGEATLTVVTATFPKPVDVAVHGSGNLLVTDNSTNTIQTVSTGGVATLLAGSPGLQGAADGNGSLASFRLPGGIALDSTGNVFLTDTGNSIIRKITPTGTVTTFAGALNFQGFRDGTGTNAWFNTPAGIAADSAGNLFVADTGNSVIRKITPAGVVTTLAGTPGQRGSVDGAGAAALFNEPSGIAVDGSGTLFVADTLNQTIRRITSSGSVTTLAGLAGVVGITDGTGANALFNRPLGVTLDSAGNLYITDSGNATVRMITSGGTVSTLAGLPGISGFKDGTGSDAWFNQPMGLRLDGAGNIYIADSGNAMIRRLAAGGVVTTWVITQGSSTTDQPPPPPTTNEPQTQPQASSSGGGSLEGWFAAVLGFILLSRRLNRPRAAGPA